MRRIFTTIIVLLLTNLCVAGIATTSQPSSPPDWPKDWLAAWQDPPVECRPLQIVHGITPKQANVEHMTAMRELGLGGMVCNVRFKDYL
ncbi:MAG: hypothetical protein ACYTF1_10925, partial [Planctomycetota bacterium]